MKKQPKKKVLKPDDGKTLITKEKAKVFKQMMDNMHPLIRDYQDHKIKHITFSDKMDYIFDTYRSHLSREEFYQYLDRYKAKDNELQKALEASYK